jgi:hypothetical protein
MRTLVVAVAAMVMALAIPAAASAQVDANSAQATGVRCANVATDGVRATHVFADFIPCSSVRSKLRRWLRRDSMPRNPNGWYCYRVGGDVNGCSYPGRRNARMSFTFWLSPTAGAAAPVRECGRIGSSIYNITSRVVPCARARRLVRQFVADPACTEDRYCRHAGWSCTQLGYRVPGGYEIDSRCTRPEGRVVRYQFGDGG